jgi:hypothetical protein
MPLRSVLHLAATTPAEHQESPVNTAAAADDNDNDDDLAVLPQEKRIQLALAAAEGGRRGAVGRHRLERNGA